MKAQFFRFLLILLGSISSASSLAQAEWQVGVGRADITGAPYGRHRMGYVKEDQLTDGIHTRLYARAFVLREPQSGRTFAYVIADLGMIFKSVQRAVLKQLRIRHDDLFHDANLMLTATHTHSGPAGLSHNHMFNLFYGFEQDDFDFVVAGIVAAIDEALENVAPGRILHAAGEAAGLGTNRSRAAFRLNPETEREADVDTKMQLLKFLRADGQALGAFNWFPVHPTSMGNENTLVSGDNKGVAALLFEGHEKTQTRKFVAGFANANAGDVSPVPNRWQTEQTSALGSDTELARVVGDGQFQAALRLYKSARDELAPELDYRQAWVAMPGFTFEQDGHQRSLCAPALGYSMFAGAEDGRGKFAGFREGMLAGEKFALDLKSRLARWGVQSVLLQNPRLETVTCQYPKPVLADFSGEARNFAPEHLPFQIVRIGKVALLGVPAELTTVAGRRLIRAVEPLLAPVGITEVVIAGLANDYSGYVTTFEEYQAQQYEGASTYYGPDTLGAYIAIFRELAGALASGKESTLDRAETRAEMRAEAARNESVARDWGVFPHRFFTRSTPWGSDGFGKIAEEVHRWYRRGELVKFRVTTPYPNLYIARESSYFAIERWEEGAWKTIARDGDLDTQVTWNLSAIDSTIGQQTTTWRIPRDAKPGRYRIVVYGAWKSGWTGARNNLKTSSQSFRILR